MDLIDYRRTYGLPELRKIGEAAGLPRGYIQQLVGCYKSVSLPVAEALHRVEPKLDILAMMRMRAKMLELREKALKAVKAGAPV